jgi:ubiquinone/menaquinone biosynthesis C-methylase UbiE
MNNYCQKLATYIAIKYFITTGKLLDMGCGNGDYIWAFANLGYKTYGIDKLNTHKMSSRIFKYCNLETDEIPFKNNYFDFIFTKSVIEHIYNTENFMEEAYRVLKRNGKIVIMTPDYKSRYKDFWEEYSHLKPFTLKSLWHCLEYFGFKNVKVERFYQLPFLWHRPYLKFIPKVISLLPDSLKWRDKKQTKHRVLIRFSKELMLLGYGEK